MPTEEEQIQARRDALREAKLAQLAKGRQKREPRGESPLRRSQRAKRARAKAERASTEALRKLEAAASVSLDKPKRTNQQDRIDRKLREIQGLNQTTDSNNE